MIITTHLFRDLLQWIIKDKKDSSIKFASKFALAGIQAKARNVACLLNLNESVRLFSPKSTMFPLLFTAGVSLQYCHKRDVFE